MADKPALFSGSMVRALLREIAAPGTGKRQTRRTFKSPVFNLEGGTHPALAIGKEYFSFHVGDTQWATPAEATKYRPGDRLWVREAWRSYHRYDAKRPRDLNPSSPIYYEAGGIGEDEISVMRGKLRPSMFMPRWASRITLEVTGVEVERLQDCSREDVIAEGLIRVPAPANAVEMGCDYSFEGDSRFGSPVSAYAALWDHINGPGAWDKNPWVAAYTFRPILGNIDQLTEAA